MGKVEQIEQAVESLTVQELAEFRHWFAAFDADAWDWRIEADARSGKLDALRDEALPEHAEGRTRPL